MSHHVEIPEDIEIPGSSLWSKWPIMAGIGGLGLVATFATIGTNKEHVLYSYLFAFMTVLSIALGSLAFSERKYISNPRLLFLSEALQCIDTNMSARTLRRRLEKEGTSYQRIKDNARRDVAISLLSRDRLTVSEVAEQVGFSDPSAFHRSFKKWTGQSPGSYR